MIVCFKSWHPSHQYKSDTGSMLFSSSKSDLMLPVRLRSWHSLQELTLNYLLSPAVPEKSFTNLSKMTNALGAFPQQCAFSPQR
jgi:hypothetical protein